MVFICGLDLSLLLIKKEAYCYLLSTMVLVLLFLTFHSVVLLAGLVNIYYLCDYFCEKGCRNEDILFYYCFLQKDYL